MAAPPARLVEDRLGVQAALQPEERLELVEQHPGDDGEEQQAEDLLGRPATALAPTQDEGCSQPGSEDGCHVGSDDPHAGHGDDDRRVGHRHLGQQPGQAVGPEAQHRRHERLLADAGRPEDHRRQEEDQQRIAATESVGDGDAVGPIEEVEPPERQEGERDVAAEAGRAGDDVDDRHQQPHEAGPGVVGQRLGEHRPADHEVPELRRHPGGPEVVDAGVAVTEDELVGVEPGEPTDQFGCQAEVDRPMDPRVGLDLGQEPPEDHRPDEVEHGGEHEAGPDVVGVPDQDVDEDEEVAGYAGHADDRDHRVTALGVAVLGAADRREGRPRRSHGRGAGGGHPCGPSPPMALA